MQQLHNKASLGNPSRKWRQKDIPITVFQAYPTMESLDEVFRLAKDAGFTVLEFLKRRTPEQLAACTAGCRKYGLNYIVEDWRYFGGFQDSREAGATRESQAQALELYGRDPNCMGWYVWDEPYPEQYAKARQVVDTFESLDPNRIPYTVALPSYQERYTWRNEGYTEYLTRYADEIKPPVFSLDYYPFFHEAHTPFELDQSDLYNDIGLLRKLGLERNTPIWFYFQCYRDRPNDPPMTKAMVRQQFYNCLMHGVKGMQWFLLFDYIITRDGRRGYMYDTVKRLNRELKGLENTLLALTSTHIYHGASLPNPDDESDFQPTKINCRFADDIAADELFCEIPQGISMGTFEDGYGNTYAMLVNRDFEANRHFLLRLKREMRISIVDVNGTPGEGQKLSFTTVTDSIPVGLDAGNGLLYRFSEPAASGEPIQYIFD